MRVLLFVFFLVSTHFSIAQVVRKENLSKPVSTYWDYHKTTLQSKGSYYIDESGITGLKHGQWVYYSKDSEKEEVQNYYRGKLHGQVMQYYTNEKPKQEGYFISDKQDSVYRVWYDNGNLKEEG